MKKILFVIMMLAPMSIFAQKFAHFNMANVMPEMAEWKTASAEIQKLTTQYQETLENIQKEYQAKAEEFQKLSNDSTPQAILQSKAQDLQRMEQSIQDFYQASQQDLQKQQTEKMEPILAKISAAIKKISDAGGYVYIVDISSASSAIFVNETLSTDITAQLKTELGIK